jgi:DNA-binding transcriptional regulator PaaX
MGGFHRSARGTPDRIQIRVVHRVRALADAATVDPDFPANLLIANWYTVPIPELFKGFSVYFQVLSLRTENSCGIGQ